MIRLLLGSSILGFLVGGLYTALTHYLPSLLVFDLAVMFVAVGLLGRLVYLLSVSTKVDSTVGLVVAGIVAGAFGFYASWATYIMFELNAFDLRTFKPVVLMSYALGMFKAVKNSSETAFTTLLLFWLFESAMFLVIVPGVARVNALKDTRKLCRACQTWYDEQTGFMRFQMTESRSEVPNTAAACAALPFGAIDDDPHIRLDLSACKSCMQRNSIRTTLVTYQGKNETLQDWTPVPETIVRQLHDRKPEYERFVEV